MFRDVLNALDLDAFARVLSAWPATRRGSLPEAPGMDNGANYLKGARPAQNLGGLRPPGADPMEVDFLHAFCNRTAQAHPLERGLHTHWAGVEYNHHYSRQCQTLTMLTIHSKSTGCAASLPVHFHH